MHVWCCTCEATLQPSCISILPTRGCYNSVLALHVLSPSVAATNNVVCCASCCLPPSQGVAHLVEHVTFLGSTKRENLLGTGARANAYTDFHHTVFHVHAPLTNGITLQPMLPQVSHCIVPMVMKVVLGAQL